MILPKLKKNTCLLVLGVLLLALILIKLQIPMVEWSWVIISDVLFD